MNIIKIQQRGTLTLPKKIRESLNLSEGDVLRVSENDNRIVLERAEFPEATLLRDIEKSLNDIKRGKFIEFGSISEFKKKIKGYDAR
ncbi:MAG: AbrB/MazE/SpoVT family DNA-binding domain-containing protein [Patescibacteria group bacterium]